MSDVKCVPTNLVPYSDVTYIQYCGMQRMYTCHAFRIPRVPWRRDQWWLVRWRVSVILFLRLPHPLCFFATSVQYSTLPYIVIPAQYYLRLLPQYVDEDLWRRLSSHSCLDHTWLWFMHDVARHGPAPYSCAVSWPGNTGVAFHSVRGYVIIPRSSVLLRLFPCTRGRDSVSVVWAASRMMIPSFAHLINHMFPSFNPIQSHLYPGPDQ